MLAKTARFTVRPEARERCEAAIREFVSALDDEPGTRVYVALRERGDPTRFLHVMVFDDEEADERHRHAEHTRRFVEALYPHTLEGVAFNDFTLVNAAKGDC
jgi:quinol monooxygenase YgiN